MRIQILSTFPKTDHRLAGAEWVFSGDSPPHGLLCGDPVFSASAGPVFLCPLLNLAPFDFLLNRTHDFFPFPRTMDFTFSLFWGIGATPSPHIFLSAMNTRHTEPCCILPFPPKRYLYLGTAFPPLPWKVFPGVPIQHIPRRGHSTHFFCFFFFPTIPPPCSFRAHRARCRFFPPPPSETSIQFRDFFRTFFPPPPPHSLICFKCFDFSPIPILLPQAGRWIRLEGFIFPSSLEFFESLRIR